MIQGMDIAKSIGRRGTEEYAAFALQAPDPPAAPEPSRALAAAKTAFPLVTKALTVCKDARLDLVAVLLRDALDVLAEDYLDVPGPGPGGEQTGRPPLSSPPSHDDIPERACSPPMPGQRTTSRSA